MLYILKTHAITTTSGFQLNRHRIEFTIASQEERRKKAATKRIVDFRVNEIYYIYVYVCMPTTQFFNVYNGWWRLNETTQNDRTG